jgi:uncharacterized membrane protein YcfT
MQLVVPAVLLVVALIHALPVMGVAGAAQLTRLYGVAVDDPNLELAMRHRAVLFGLLAAFMAVAAFDPALHAHGLVAGIVSVASFIVLATRVGPCSAAMLRVVRVDGVALALLLGAGAVHLLSGR